MAAAMATAMAATMAAAMAAANAVVAMMAARAAAAAAPEQPIELPMPHMPLPTWHLNQSHGRPACDGHSKDIEMLATSFGTPS